MSREATSRRKVPISSLPRRTSGLLGGCSESMLSLTASSAIRASRPSASAPSSARRSASVSNVAVGVAVMAFALLRSFAKPSPASPGPVKRPSMCRQSRSRGPLPRYACHMLRVQLLGEMSVEVGGTRLSSPESRRAWALLAWLALKPGGHPRGEMAARFWPDVLDSSARASLRSAVWSLRRALGPDGGPHLVASRDAIALEDAWCDAVEFKRLVAAGSLEEALELCQGGDLLAGFEDEWAMVARDEHRAAVADALGALAGQARDAGDLGAAAGWARKRLTLDPLSEDAARSLMDVLAAAGDRAGALAVYAKLRERFREELAMT